MRVEQGMHSSLHVAAGIPIAIVELGKVVVETAGVIVQEFVPSSATLYDRLVVIHSRETDSANVVDLIGYEVP